MNKLFMILFALTALYLTPTGSKADNSFSLNTDIVMQAIPPDSAAFFEVELVNTGDTRDEYLVVLENSLPDNWLAILCIDSLCLPGDTGQVMLDPGASSFIKPDMNPQMYPGDGEFTVVVQSGNDPANVQQVSLRAVSGYRTLLVNDGSVENQYRSYYENALISAGVDFNYWDRCFSPFRSSDLVYYDFTVIYSGDRFADLFTVDEISALSGYLDSGGNLLISGQGLASALQGTPFLENYLGVNYIDTHTGNMTVDGETGDPIGDGLQFSIVGGDGADNQVEPDEIGLTAGSVTVFTYGSGEISGSRFDNNGSRTVFLAFGIEAVDNVADRDAIVSRSFDWLGYFTSVYNEESNAPRVIELAGNYPNPFNASTTIRYYLGHESNVKIEIYDLLGRKIQSLYEGKQEPGIHHLIWNAGNISSGVYFFRIQAGGNMDAGKMLLLR